ncbi:MBL fold metallo-hydrolase [Bacillus sp. CD3-5]|uniref:MBL fold metallo-hydrolase n=1 Tax=Bacillus sp. CD3-5 TaxID=2587157 RepID=UPI00111D423D|nr:MBL fold metallo-hydrolase [Bacillus sp. CD3-5]TNP28110.1 hypothetical protein FH036_04070 [Bacillus sp. CD3-5]
MKKKYINQIHTDVSFKPKDIIGLMTDYFKMKTKLRPIKNLPIVLSDKNNESLESVTWFGHSASLLKMECGQYDPRWSAIHMLPEETVQAHMDVKGELLLPIHWGAFTLALHEWSDPIERVTKEAKRLEVKITTPQIGESITLKSTDYPSSAWWREI